MVLESILLLLLYIKGLWLIFVSSCELVSASLFELIHLHTGLLSAELHTLL